MRTPFERARDPSSTDGPREGLSALLAGLEDREVLVRNMTPPSFVDTWRVLRVLVPGLQPMHGSHDLPQLGGPLWAPRGWAEWSEVPPHPFP